MKRFAGWLGLSDQQLKLNDWLLLLLPVAVWFSYQPLIEIGQTDTMYLEMSISLLMLAAFGLTALPSIWRARRQIVTSWLSWLVIGFGLWNSLSLLWTANLLRGALTAAVIWLLVLAFLRLMTHPGLKKFLPALAKIFIGSAVVMSLLAWLQMILDIAGAPMSLTLTCVGCQFEYFGFPRATGFAIEPQFLGSLLLAPILLLLARVYSLPVTKRSASARRGNPPPVTKRSALARRGNPHIVLVGFLTLTLFMTLSRGAIYALIIGVVVLITVHFRQIRRSLLIIGLVAGSFIAALAAQGAMVALNPSVNEPFLTGVAKSIHHLSLGAIDLRSSVSPPPPPSSQPQAVYFDGYVEESTVARLSFNQLAYDAWASSPLTMLFGVGLGGSGVAMHRAHPEQIGVLEITQNEYTELPLELGAVGGLLSLAVMIAFIYTTRRQKWTWAILAAYLAQWAFFSGYPNAIHIYLVIFTLAASSAQPTGGGDSPGDQSFPRRHDGI